jgi:hypothetical protein
LSGSGEYFATALPAWVPLANVLDEIERRLGIPAAEAAGTLRPLLEEYCVRTVVVGWEKSHGARSGATNWVAQGHPGDPYPHCVHRQGWDHVDWKTGTLAGHEVRLRWADVTERLSTSMIGMNDPRSTPSNAAASDPSPDAAEAARNWMAGYVLGCSHGVTPKRDETLKLCQDKTGATYQQARAAWLAQPGSLKNPPRKPPQ